MSENSFKKKLKILDKDDKELGDEARKRLADITGENHEDKEIIEILGCYFKLKVLKKWADKQKIGEALGYDGDYLFKQKFSINDFFGSHFNDKKNIAGKTKEWEKNEELKFFIKKITLWLAEKKIEKREKESDEQYNERKEQEEKRIKNFGGKIGFAEWYLEQPRKCCYCGIEEKDLKKYFNETNRQYWRDKGDNARPRGKYLEIERIKTDSSSENQYTPENTSLACYICNNAKSDFLSAKSFKLIAEGINKFWCNYLGKNIEFPENDTIWEKDA